ncbi:MAG: hypothetical protein CM15mP123_12390 [Gammaproteobacteria bacterium]|nr:MAG: hypothetical protein CM15mP123_12390 [Gammaproteobacteria bacterium]
MNFEHSPKTKELIQKVSLFMDENVYPAEEKYTAEMKAFRDAGNPWQIPKVLNELKQKAKDQGLWNFFLPERGEFFLA